MTLVQILLAIYSVIKFDMPGDNSAIPGCSTFRATPGVASFGMLKNDDDCNVNWEGGGGGNIADMISIICNWFLKYSFRCH